MVINVKKTIRSIRQIRRSKKNNPCKAKKNSRQLTKKITTINVNSMTIIVQFP